MRTLVVATALVLAGLSGWAIPSHATVTTKPVTGTITLSLDRFVVDESGDPYAEFEQAAACDAQLKGQTETSGSGLTGSGSGLTGWMLHVTPGASFTLADYRGQLGPVREYEGFTIAFYSAPPPSCTSRGTLLYRTREFAFVPVTDRVPGGAIVGIVTHNVDPSVSGLVCPTGCFPPARTPVVTASGLPSTFTYTETLTPGAPNCCVVSVVQTSQGKGQGQGKAASVVTLAWGDPLRFGGVGPITSYNIYRGTVEGAETLLVSLPVDQITVTESGMYSYTDKAVTPGHMYFYQLAAVNSYGEGDRTYEVRITA